MTDYGAVYNVSAPNRIPGWRKEKSISISLEHLIHDPNGFNYQTIMALKEACDNKNLSKRFKSVKALFEDLNA